MTINLKGGVTMKKEEIELKLKKIENRFRLRAFILFTKNMALREKYYNLLTKLHEVENDNKYFEKNTLLEWKNLLLNTSNGRE